MEHSVVSDNLQIQLRELIAQRMGLHFPPNRWRDLQRGLAGALAELGFVDLATGAEWLLASPLTRTEVDVLASHLTIGETYFFREKKTFEILTERVLPDLIRLRRKGGRRLRIWSAACCTGEEAYSLAILLQQLIPDLADWFVTILATDINPRFLQKATAGVYGAWSFRETPPWFKDCYFKRTEEGRYAILPEIKKRVTFAQLNLVQDSFPSLATGTNAMDLILCRNVLIYFSPAQAHKVVSDLRRALVHDGWLVVAPSEASQTLFCEFAPVNFPGVILYQKRRVAGEGKYLGTPHLLGENAPMVGSEFRTPFPSAPTAAYGYSEPESAQVLKETIENNPQANQYGIAAALFEDGKYDEVVDTLLSLSGAPATPDPEKLAILTRALANQGKLAEALTWCERWVEADRLNPTGHYVRAIILQELGDAEQSRRSLQTATYLDPRFVLAHFALGNLARSRGKIAEANKHFANATRLLLDYKAGDILPESDGLTAERLTEVITYITALEVSP